MSYCVMCGLPVPDGQNTCSMCYGDPYHGSDGYYLAELERERYEEDMRREYERDMLAARQEYSDE